MAAPPLDSATPPPAVQPISVTITSTTTATPTSPVPTSASSPSIPSITSTSSTSASGPVPVRPPRPMSISPGRPAPLPPNAATLNAPPAPPSGSLGTGAGDASSSGSSTATLNPTASTSAVGTGGSSAGHGTGTQTSAGGVLPSVFHPPSKPQPPPIPRSMTMPGPGAMDPWSTARMPPVAPVLSTRSNSTAATIPVGPLAAMSTSSTSSNSGSSSGAGLSTSPSLSSSGGTSELEKERSAAERKDLKRREKIERESAKLKVSEPRNFRHSQHLDEKIAKKTLTIMESHGLELTDMNMLLKPEPNSPAGEPDKDKKKKKEKDNKEVVIGTPTGFRKETEDEVRRKMTASPDPISPRPSEASTSDSESIQQLGTEGGITEREVDKDIEISEPRDFRHVQHWDDSVAKEALNVIPASGIGKGEVEMLAARTQSMASGLAGSPTGSTRNAEQSFVADQPLSPRPTDPLPTVPISPRQKRDARFHLDLSSAKSASAPSTSATVATTNGTKSPGPASPRLISPTSFASPVPASVVQHSSTTTSVATTSSSNSGQDELKTFLEGLGLGHLVEVFREEEIEFDLLAKLTPEEFTQLGIKMGPRKKIMEKLQERAAASSASGVLGRSAAAVSALSQSGQIVVPLSEWENLRKKVDELERQGKGGSTKKKKEKKDKRKGKEATPLAGHSVPS